MTSSERRAAVSLAGIFGLRMLGMFLILPVFAVHAAAMPGGVDSFRVGLAMGIYGLTQALLQIPFGMASDRYGRKPVITVGLLLMVLGSVIAAMAQTVDGLTIGRAIQGAGAVSAAIAALLAEMQALRVRVERIPYLDPIDLRYRSRVKVPVPTSKAVMFCLMDVSGSMDEQRKELSKRFFILLYLFLTRHYEKIDLVFIRHHTQAQEVDEQNFFHARETGGTVVSSALVLMEEIIKARYNPSEWNIYGAQASDGDNWHHDSGRCREILSDKLLPLVRYFAYVQVAEEEQNLWEEYSQLLETHRHFAMRKATSADQIYPVFRDLFRKEGAKAA